MPPPLAPRSDALLALLERDIDVATDTHFALCDDARLKSLQQKPSISTGLNKNELAKLKLEKSIKAQGHDLHRHTFLSPTFCESCGNLLLGLFHQGFQCNLCGLNCHRKCAQDSARCPGVQGTVGLMTSSNLLSSVAGGLLYGASVRAEVASPDSEDNVFSSSTESMDESDSRQRQVNASSVSDFYSVSDDNEDDHVGQKNTAIFNNKVNSSSSSSGMIQRKRPVQTVRTSMSNILQKSSTKIVSKTQQVQRSVASAVHKKDSAEKATKMLGEEVAGDYGELMPSAPADQVRNKFGGLLQNKIAIGEIFRAVFAGAAASSLSAARNWNMVTRFVDENAVAEAQTGSHCKLSKSFLDFGFAGRPVPVVDPEDSRAGCSVTDRVTIFNHSQKKRYFRAVWHRVPKLEAKVEPERLVLRPGESTQVTVSLRAFCTTKLRMLGYIAVTANRKKHLDPENDPARHRLYWALSVESELSPTLDPERLNLTGETIKSGYGQLLRATWRTNDVAIKPLRPGANFKQAHAQVAALARHHHNNVVSFLGTTFLSDNGSIVTRSPPFPVSVVMQWYQSRSLESVLFGEPGLFGKDMPALHAPVAQRQRWCVQICKGLAFLHSHNFVHRDLSPRRILIREDDGVAMIKVSTFNTRHHFINRHRETSTRDMAAVFGLSQDLQHVHAEGLSANLHAVDDDPDDYVITSNNKDAFQAPEVQVAQQHSTVTNRRSAAGKSADDVYEDDTVYLMGIDMIKADIFAFGLTCCTVLAEVSPAAMKLKDIVARVHTGLTQVPNSVLSMSSDIVDSVTCSNWETLLLDCMDLVPTNRPPMQNVLRRMQSLLNSKSFFQSSVELPSPKLDSSDISADPTPSANNSVEAFSKTIVSKYHRWLIPYDDIILGLEIGYGSFGTVYRGRYKHTDAAIKVTRAFGEKEINEFLAEAEIMMEMRPHPNVLQLYGVSLDHNRPILVFPFLQGGSLERLLRQRYHQPVGERFLPESVLMHIVLGVARGMEHLHANNIVHRDLASRNILMAGILTTSGSEADQRASIGEVQICDFGLSRLSGEGDEEAQTQQTFGPIPWMAPEALMRRYSTKSDCWSFGVLVWECVTLERPWAEEELLSVAIGIRDKGWTLPIPGRNRPTGSFDAKDDRHLSTGPQHQSQDDVDAEPIGPAEVPHCPSVLVAVMDKCWTPDPQQRADMGQLLELMEPQEARSWISAAENVRQKARVAAFAKTHSRPMLGGARVAALAPHEQVQMQADPACPPSNRTNSSLNGVYGAVDESTLQQAASQLASSIHSSNLLVDASKTDYDELPSVATRPQSVHSIASNVSVKGSETDFDELSGDPARRQSERSNISSPDARIVSSSRAEANLPPDDNFSPSPSSFANTTESGIVYGAINESVLQAHQSSEPRSFLASSLIPVSVSDTDYDELPGMPTRHHSERSIASPASANGTDRLSEISVSPAAPSSWTRVNPQASDTNTEDDPVIPAVNAATRSGWGVKPTASPYGFPVFLDPNTRN